MTLKVLAFLVTLVVTQALPLVPEVGGSVQYKTEDNHGNYAYGYSEDHSSGGSFMKESGDSMGNKVGSYGLHDADGRARVVNYVADSAGFRADVNSNEQGLDHGQDSADVSVNKPVVLASAGTVVAPTVVAHPSAVVAHPPAVVAHAPAILASTYSLHHGLSLLHPPVFHMPYVFVPHPSHTVL